MAGYIITRQADEDIEEILIFIAADNFEAALALNDRLTTRFEVLAQMPKAGRERPELMPQMRSFSEGNYLIFYRELEKAIAIVRVLHSARDLDEIFR